MHAHMWWLVLVHSRFKGDAEGTQQLHHQGRQARVTSNSLSKRDFLLSQLSVGSMMMQSTGLQI